MKLIIVVLATYQCVSCAFFDLTDIDDPLSLLWNTKESIIGERQQPCSVQTQGTSITGVCKHKTQCLLSGGQIHGHGSCGILSTCCSYQTPCSKRTKSKVSYFTSGQRDYGQCDYIVEAENDNICQIRLDFELFHLSGPAAGADGTSQCVVDSFTVTPSPYNIPPLCGNNDGQHVYVHLYTNREVRLNVILANRNLSAEAINNPRWKVKVTQLECPGKQKFFAKHFPWNAITDFPQLAPEGAIQYFTAPSGTFRSFGFDGRTASSYTAGLNYAIAFRRTPDVNCIRFTSKYFTLRPPVDENCLDYLYVPERAEDGKLSPDPKLCALGETGVFFSSPPGPFFIHFVTDPTATFDESKTYAFDLEYDLSVCKIH